jgi:hypothetical protein
VSGVILFHVFRLFAAIRRNLGVGFYLVGLLYVVDFLEILSHQTNRPLIIQLNFLS